MNNFSSNGNSSFGPASGFRISSSSSRGFIQSNPTDVVVTRTISPFGNFAIDNANATDHVIRKDENRLTAPGDSSWFRSSSSRNAQLSDSESISHPSSHVVESVRSSSSCGSMDSMRNRDNSSAAMPWFHSNITRDTTERFLLGKGDGTFLVRESTNFPGDYTLSMSYRGKVEHYRIYQNGGHLTCDNEEFFSNLTQLVSHYKRDADGLCHRLVTPVICDTYRMPASNIEDRTSIFVSAGLVIPTDEIQLGDIIGHGEFGDVLSGVYKTRRVAVKVSKRHGSGLADCLLDEARLIVGVSHRNLVALVGVVLDDVNVYMVIEFMANGNLVDLLRSRGRHQLERPQLIQFAIDICSGMCYLESRQIVHRDLAARNVLLDEEMTAKVSDFGLAKKANTVGVDSSAGKFPIKWTAPEALRQSNFSSKSDMWSFGVLLWEIFSFGRVPYPRIPIQDVVRHIERGYRMEAPEGCPADIVSVMHDAWALKPTDRPSFVEVQQRLTTIARNLMQ